jgi:hypothetical protein
MVRKPGLSVHKLNANANSNKYPPALVITDNTYQLSRCLIYFIFIFLFVILLYTRCLYSLVIHILTMKL